MNLKSILLGALILLLVIGLVSFSYSTYALLYDTAEGTGNALVRRHQLLFYLQLVLHLLGLLTGGLVIWRR